MKKSIHCILLCMLVLCTGAFARQSAVRYVATQPSQILLEGRTDAPNGYLDNNLEPPLKPSTNGTLSDPRSSIAYQFDLIKAGDMDQLKACLTPRVRDSLTKEIVEKAQGEAAQYTLDDLYSSAEMGEADGKKTAKVKMKNGRTLTTLIEIDGQWLSDTIWYR